MSNISQMAEIDAGPFASEDSQFALLKHGISIDPHALAIQVTCQPVNHLQHLRLARALHNQSSVLSWTYADMQHAALKVVAGFRVLGIQPHSTLITLLPNGLEWAILYWASMVGKSTFVSLDPAVVTVPRSAELQTLLADTIAGVIVVPDSVSATAVDQALSAIDRRPAAKVALELKDVVNEWRNLSTVTSTYVDENTRNQIESEALDDDIDRVCQIMFTSGTISGKSKGCPWTVKMYAHIAQVAEWGSQNGPGTRKALTTANFRVIAPVAAISTWGAVAVWYCRVSGSHRQIFCTL